DCRRAHCGIADRVVAAFRLRPVVPAAATTVPVAVAAVAFGPAAVGPVAVIAPVVEVAVTELLAVIFVVRVPVAVVTLMRAAHRTMPAVSGTTVPCQDLVRGSTQQAHGQGNRAKQETLHGRLLLHRSVKETVRPVVRPR